jgi:hypothetical protein
MIKTEFAWPREFLATIPAYVYGIFVSKGREVADLWKSEIRRMHRSTTLKKAPNAIPEPVLHDRALPNLTVYTLEPCENYNEISSTRLEPMLSFRNLGNVRQTKVYLG